MVKYALSFILGACSIMILDMVWASKGYAQVEMKNCQDLTTGQVIQVPANMPCPFPMAEV
jgi:hypothetical protein